MNLKGIIIIFNMNLMRKQALLLLIIVTNATIAMGRQAENTATGSASEEWDLSKYIWSQTHTKNRPNDKPPLDFRAIDSWISLGDDRNLAVSNDGRYFGYMINNEPVGSNTLVVQSIGGSWSQAFEGADVGFFTDDNKQYVFKNGDRLCFLNLEKQELTCATGVISYKHTKNWLAYQTSATDTFSFLLKNLVTKKEYSFKDIVSYFFDKTGQFIALQTKTKELKIYNLSTENEIHFPFVDEYLFDDHAHAILLKTTAATDSGVVTKLQYSDLINEKTETIWSGLQKGNRVVTFNFDISGKQILFVVKSKSTKNSGEGISTFDSIRLLNESNNSIWLYKVGMSKAALLVSNKNNKIHNDLIIQDPFFVQGGKYIMFILQRPTQILKAKQEAVKVDIWSYKDTFLQSTQAYLNNEPKTYRAVVSTEGGGVILLETDYESVTTWNGDFAVVTKTGKQVYGDRFWEPGYNVDSNWLVSFRNGSRRMLQTKGNLTVNLFKFSPDGKFLVYFDLNQGCNYFSYDLVSSEVKNISTGIPANQLGIGGEYIRPNKATHRAGIVAWVFGSYKILVYDQYDIWELDLRGRNHPVNITNGFGRKNEIQLRVSGSQEFNDMGNLPFVRSGDTLLLKATIMRNKSNGFYQKVLGTHGNPTLLYVGPFVFEMTIPSDHDQGMKPIKAANANIWIAKRQTATESPNYFVTTDFKSYHPLTDIHPERQYNWLTAELHSFKQLDGTITQGILYKPQNFDSSKKYPVIIGFYEQLSRMLNQFLAPAYLESPLIEVPWLVSHGYIVFTPDIYFTVKNWGPSTVNTVVGAAGYLSKLSYVDSNHIGATGHSNSGRFGYYLLTHSRSFAAMSIGGGTTDLISAALSLWQAGGGHMEESNLEWAEVTATGTGLGNLWQNKELWVQQTSVLNADKVVSPVLMFHCKKDGMGDKQAIEMYVALRRLDKEVWWLQYDNGGHTVDGIDGKDFTIRYTQFMDHYLKNAPPPLWMTKGIPFQLKGIENRYALDHEEHCEVHCPMCTKQKSHKQ